MEEFKKFMNEPFIEGAMETNEKDWEALEKIVENFYKSKNVSKEILEQFVVHNKQVKDFVMRFSKKESFNEREKEIAILSAILHDIAKGSGKFESHGEEGGEIAKKILLEMGKSVDLAESVKLAIVRHMGKEGYPTEAAKKKYGDDFEYPEPATKVGQLVYECDILTQLTPEGFEKILHLRKIDEENIEEDQKTAFEKNTTQGRVALLSVLKSAGESRGSISVGSSIETFAEELWQKIQEDYKNYFEDGELIK